MLISVSKSQIREPWAQTHFVPHNVVTATEFNAIAMTQAWSPIVWKENYRKAANFLQCGLCVLDFDDGAVTIEAATARAQDEKLFFIIGTTKSHQVAKNDKPACDRFRLVLKFSEIITSADQYTQNMKRVAKAWGSDPAACDAGRWFAPCKTITEASNGLPLIVAPAEPKWVSRDQLIYPKGEKRIPLWVKEALTQGIAPGQRNATLYRVCKSLQKFGWQRDDALSLILKSNIDLTEKEIFSVVRSAYR